MSEPRRAMGLELPPDVDWDAGVARDQTLAKPRRRQHLKASPRLQAVLIAEAAVILFLIFVVVGSQLGAWR